MSAYQKFIDSASPKKLSTTSTAANNLNSPHQSAFKSPKHFGKIFRGLSFAATHSQPEAVATRQDSSIRGFAKEGNTSKDQDSGSDSFELNLCNHELESRRLIAINGKQEERTQAKMLTYMQTNFTNNHNHRQHHHQSHQGPDFQYPGQLMHSHNHKQNQHVSNQQTSNLSQTRQYCSSRCYHKRHYCQNCATRPSLASFWAIEDPALLSWLKAMRFETEPECLSSLQARTLAIDESSAGALSVRNSQVAIQELRLQSDFILDFADHLIELLPLAGSQPVVIDKFAAEFTELWLRIMEQTGAASQASQTTTTSIASQQQLTIVNCTPKKTNQQPHQVARQLSSSTGRLISQMRNVCIECAQHLYEAGERPNDRENIDDNTLESSLRKIKELYGSFVEISIRSHCANIVRALNYDFSQQSLNRLSSTASLRPARPFESSSSQLPLKWALIALWQLTKDDNYICRTLTEKWQTVCDAPMQEIPAQMACSPARSAKRLDYSTKYDRHPIGDSTGSSSLNSDTTHSLRSDYQKLREITLREHQQPSVGALSCALNGGQQVKKELAMSRLQSSVKSQHMSTIELLIGIIISQPNKHERLDIMRSIRDRDQHCRLIEVDELAQQSVLAAVYTSNQYKVAALRILNHLCVNDQAIKTILKCFSTPPPDLGQPNPENKIIKSIFECYQTSQEHIYQNETMFQAGASGQQQRKRSRQQHPDYFTGSTTSDYGSSRHIYGSSSISAASGSETGGDSGEGNIDEGDDQVVKEAMRLLVQLTAPFQSSQGLDYYTLIGRFSISLLVSYLTNIIKSSQGREMLLLALTGLANISFITSEPMKKYMTTSCILEMFRSSKSRSKDLDMRDQALTILANASDKDPLEVVKSGGLAFLLGSLESCPSKMANYKQLVIDNKPRNRKPVDLGAANECTCGDQQRHLNRPIEYLAARDLNQCAQSANVDMGFCWASMSQEELGAMERIHQKTAVAFARLSNDRETTWTIHELGGVKRLIDMCKIGALRNHSNTVLMACVTALRKLNVNGLHRDVFELQSALDLIDLDWEKVLKLYGQQEALQYRASPRKFSNSPSPTQDMKYGWFASVV